MPISTRIGSLVGRRERLRGARDRQRDAGGLEPEPRREIDDPFRAVALGAQQHVDAIGNQVVVRIGERAVVRVEASRDRSSPSRRRRAGARAPAPPPVPAPPLAADRSTPVPIPARAAGSAARARWRTTAAASRRARAVALNWFSATIAFTKSPPFAICSADGHADRRRPARWRACRPRTSSPTTP